jgi:hypothetical protein
MQPGARTTDSLVADAFFGASRVVCWGVADADLFPFGRAPQQFIHLGVHSAGSNCAALSLAEFVSEGRRQQ